MPPPARQSPYFPSLCSVADCSGLKTCLYSCSWHLLMGRQGSVSPQDGGRALVATHPAVPVVIHGLQVLLNDPKLHGNEEVTGCTVGCLYLLHKMFHGNFCRGEKEGVTTGPRHLRKTQELGENARPAPHLALPFPCGPEAVLTDPPWGNRGVL